MKLQKEKKKLKFLKIKTNKMHNCANNYQIKFKYQEFFNGI